MSSSWISIWGDSINLEWLYCLVLTEQQLIVALVEMTGLSISTKLGDLYPNACGYAINDQDSRKSVPSSINSGDQGLPEKVFNKGKSVRRPESDKSPYWTNKHFKMALLLPLFLAFIALSCSSPQSWSKCSRHHAEVLSDFVLDGRTVYPDLLDVDSEELIAGLESGAFTSVDLTKVYH
jgi:hypothetical protein